MNVCGESHYKTVPLDMCNRLVALEGKEGKEVSGKKIRIIEKSLKDKKTY